MFSNFFKKDAPAPAKAPPPAPNPQQQQSLGASPPAGPVAGKKTASAAAPQQQPLRAGVRPAHFQDPLIATGAGAGVFQPSAQNLFAATAPDRESPRVTSSLKSSSTFQSATTYSANGIPRVEKMDVGCGDTYTGEVVFNLPQELSSPAGGGAAGAGGAAGGAGGGVVGSRSSEQIRASFLLQQQQQLAASNMKPIPHGIGELMSDSGRQTFTGYFVQGQRDGIGQLVTSRFMLWGFWKHNTVDVASSVRLDSLETLVKYRGFVRMVTNDGNLKSELLDLQSLSKTGLLSPFSAWVATARFVREGWGEAVFPDGRHVFGRWENDQLFGFGTQLTPDGERFVGMFHQSKFHGFGVLFLPNGAVCEGDWNAGVFKNANGALTIPNRCVLSGQFTDRNAFSRVNIQLLDSSSTHTREDIETGLSYVARTHYNSLFFWATNAAVLREEALQQAVPLLALVEQQTDPRSAAKLLESEIRARLIKTKRFDNAVRIAQRIIFLMWGSCGSPSYIHSGNGRTALGIMPSRTGAHAPLDGSILAASSTSRVSFSGVRNGGLSGGGGGAAASSSLSSSAAAGGGDGSSATAGLATNPGVKPVAPNQALGWCETQRSGGCIHSGTGHPITPQTARQLFEDMLSFSTSCRRYWAQLFEIARDIRRTNSGKNNPATSQQRDDEADDDEDNSVLDSEELLNIVSRAAFDAIFGACRRLAINVFSHAFYAEQVSAETALERLRDVTLNDVGIEFARQSDDVLFDIYADATRELERSFVSQVPTDILHGLHRWSMTIDSATRESQTAGGSADDLIPIHQFTLLRAKIPHLVPMTKLVSWMGEQPCFVDPTSAESFCLTTLQACVSMLGDLRSNIRDTQGVLQSPSALEARVDDTLSLLDDQSVPVQIVRRAADYCANMLVLLLGHRQQFLKEITTTVTSQRQKMAAAAAAAAASSDLSLLPRAETAAPPPSSATSSAELNDAIATPERKEKNAENESVNNRDGDKAPAQEEHGEVPPTAALIASPSPLATAKPVMRVEPVFLLPPDALHIMPPSSQSQQQQQQQQREGGNVASRTMMRLRNSSIIHNSSPPPPSASDLAAAAALLAGGAHGADPASSSVPSPSSSPGGGNVPTHGRARGNSVSSAPLNKSLDEQMLHAVSMILEATGCQLAIAKVTIADSLRPNRVVAASNVVNSTRKNSFGIKEAFGDATPGVNTEGVPTKWCFVVKVPPQLLLSAPQLKIYTTKLSTL